MGIDCSPYVPVQELGRVPNKSNRRQMRNKHMEPVFYTAYGQILESSILHGFER